MFNNIHAYLSDEYKRILVAFEIPNGESIWRKDLVECIPKTSSSRNLYIITIPYEGNDRTGCHYLAERGLVEFISTSAIVSVSFSKTFAKGTLPHSKMEE